MEYVNLRRSWLVYADFRQDDPLMKKWPRCDGAVVAGIGQPLLERIARQIKHVVSCGTGTDPAVMPVVCADAAASGAMAAEHLIDCRLKSFGYCGWSVNPLSEQRLHGFRQALRRRGHDCSVALVNRARFGRP